VNKEDLLRTLAGRMTVPNLKEGLRNNWRIIWLMVKGSNRRRIANRYRISDTSLRIIEESFH